MSSHSRDSLRILVIGGTVFLGRHIVQSAIERGHHLTLFNRGQHNPGLFPEVEKLRGDRREDLSGLEGPRWDAVIDTSGYFPRDVRRSVGILAPYVDHYTFVSTLSVFADLLTEPGIEEDGRLATTEDVDATEITGENYGPLKALCEREALDAMPGRCLVVRPGLIVGPYDPSDRFTYWPVRLKRGGDVLAPEGPRVRVQLIDARDLAEWIVRSVEDGLTGIFNATGPDLELTLGEVLASCQDVASVPSRLVWVDADWLAEQGAAPWTEVPLWIPNAPGISAVDCGKAIANGLTFRPTRETVEDTLRWAETREGYTDWRAGL